MLTEKDGKLWRRYDKELLCIEAYGKNSLRVRATQLAHFQDDRLSALMSRRREGMRRSGLTGRPAGSGTEIFPAKSSAPER